MIATIAERYGAVILVTVLVGIPLGAAVAALAARARQRRGWPREWAWRASLAEVGIVVGTAPWLWMILAPTDGAGGLQLVPFRDLADVLAGGDTLVQLVGNLLAFAAVGFFAPLRWRLAPPWAVPLAAGGIAAALSVVVEVVQLLFPLGRVASIDDVIVNALGAALASLLSMRWWRSKHPLTQVPFKRAITVATEDDSLDRLTGFGGQAVGLKPPGISTPTGRDPDEVAVALTFVTEIREAFEGLVPHMRFHVISPSQVEFLADGLSVGIEREHLGYEVVGRVSSGDCVATFDEIARLAGEDPVAPRPQSISEMREVASSLAGRIQEVVLLALEDPARRIALFRAAERVRSELNRDAAAARPGQLEG